VKYDVGEKTPPSASVENDIFKFSLNEISDYFFKLNNTGL
jgi:hypothetical protein